MRSLVRYIPVAIPIIAAVLAGCQIAPPVAPRVPAAAPRATFSPMHFDALPGWRDDRVEAVWPAFLVGCRALTSAPAMQPIWQAPCAAAILVNSNDSAAVRAFFENNFSVYRIGDGDGTDVGLVTGYYEPLLAGARSATEKFRAPLYAVPDDLLIVDLATLYPELKDKRVRGRIDGRRVVPYWPRADIEHGNPSLAAKAIAFVADPIDAFFLQIQGSGRIKLDDGSVMRVGYADQNGHPFRSIARVLIERGELTPELASKQAIEAWGRAHPDALPALLDENPSYVFFREVPPPASGSLDAAIDGPIGSLGVPLLAERTVAVDARFIPLGAPIFLSTTYPLSSRPLQRLVMAQDTGGAIRGATRADFFWGFGDAAGREAGRMRQDGRLWLIWPKNAPLPSS
ncbi:MAG TPA: MltA domain-containing protein [Casimicrobiaceae bacterium]